MLLINDKEGSGWESTDEGGRRASTDNQHKYPTTGSKGNVAAGIGLSAEGLINDSSVDWRCFLFTVIQISTWPRVSKRVDYSSTDSLIINQTGDIISMFCQQQHDFFLRKMLYDKHGGELAL